MKYMKRRALVSRCYSEKVIVGMKSVQDGILLRINTDTISFVKIYKTVLIDNDRL